MLQQVIYSVRGRPDTDRVEISTSAWEHLWKQRQLTLNDPEAGGVLTGREILYGGFVIDRAHGPNPADSRFRTYFVRTKTEAQDQITRAWESTGGAEQYLGEWHSHPEDYPRPSLVDRMGWLRLALHLRRERDLLFFAIVGRKEIRLWRVKRGRMRRLHLLTK